MSNDTDNRVSELDAAARERDALAAVIEEARGVARKFAATSDTGDYGWGKAKAGAALAEVLSRTPSDVLVERDARIRAEVIDWFAHETFPYVVNKARTHFGLTKGADRG